MITYVFLPRARWRVLSYLSYLALLFAFFGVLPSAQAQQRKARLATSRPAKPATSTAYYGVYLRSNKIGYMTLARDETARVNGKPAVKSESRMIMDLTALGATTRTVSITRTYSDPKTGAPLLQESRAEAAGRVTEVVATYGKDSLSYSATVQGNLRQGTLTLNPGERFLTDPSEGTTLSNRSPKVGQVLRGKIFVADTLQLIDTETKVVAEETVARGTRTVPAFKLVDTNSIAESTYYVAREDGAILKMNLALGIEVVKQSKETALAPSTGRATDLALAVSVKPTGEPLTAPVSATAVVYEIGGSTRALPPSDQIQTVETLGGIARVTVTPVPLPESAGVSAFATAEAAPERLRSYLQSTIYIPASDPEFRVLARTVIGSETDIARAASRLADYVHRTIQPDPSIAALRTAQDIKKDPRGVCRDYTTLFTALARASGIPTRQCVGLAYAEGMFLYHAWPEVWIGTDTATGADRWVALEPTWGRPYADAGHIKLAQGEITDLYSVSADMGKYTIRVVRTETPTEVPEAQP